MAQFPQEMLDDPIFQQAFRELEMMAQDPAEREAYEKRLRDLSEERARKRSFLKQGFNDGHLEGRAEERAEALRRQIRFLERLLHLPAMAEDRLAALSLAELEQQAADLEQRCLANVERQNGDANVS